jgi:hypothetical protein
MQYTVHHGIIEFDSSRENGWSFRFFLEVRTDELIEPFVPSLIEVKDNNGKVVGWRANQPKFKVIERLEWTDVDERNGRYNAVVAPVKDKYLTLIREAAKAKDEAQKDAASKEKKTSEECRRAAIKEDEAALNLLNEVIASHEKTVNEYKTGKANAINFLTGQVIKECKARSIEIEGGAFAVTELLKRRLQKI